MSPPPASAATTAPELATTPAPTSVLSQERASSIGWYFIVSYYDFYNTNIENIHKIYHQNASISHDSFPVDSANTAEDEVKTIHAAHGTEAIRTRFKNDPELKANNRIVVTSAAFEVSLEKNILIVVFGEWAKEDSVYHQFTQTFVLTPGKKENSFDVANDVLRFIDFGEFKAVKKEEKKPVRNGETINASATAATTTEASTSTPKAASSATSISANSTSTSTSTSTAAPTSTAATTVPVAAATPTVATVAASAASANTTAVSSAASAESETTSASSVPSEEKQKPEAPVTPEPVEKSETKESTQEPVKELSPTDSVASKNEEESSTAVTAKSAPGQPLSWAALASQAAPPKNKPVAVAKLSPAPAKKAATTPPANGIGSKKKEEWYPIYIRGIRELDEKLLRDHISKHFGELKYFKTNSNIALCDFVTYDAQHKALEAGETIVDGIVISLEPRESKTGNSYHSINKKKDKPAGSAVTNSKQSPQQTPQQKAAKGEKKVVGKKSNRTATRSD
ncbi:predicted protein [Scheffersomyces stipitis CBS 6054]|uniref:NTF2 domain-containing protein n=1 Tax=Scheffersomyces stipitis (strain ATCC 58785 / CBS 6054 / NBRC 10063 / NRRL Y-11545) TaxID=322104 RepID=A3LRK2_PICST|nr:predicted protein [Scheffersomyces stipitis CBS 6054]ABN65751.2 predicted protein [Scheffersomyces stipitis CBS 6054]